MPDLTIRVAREEDAGAIVDLLNPIIDAGIYTAIDTPLTIDDQLDFMAGLPAHAVFHVAVTDGREGERVVGLQSVEPFAPAAPELAHVGSIATFVALGAHRRGVGRMLTAITVEAARTCAYRKLLATVRASNAQAIAFYRSQGFAIIGTARRHERVRGAYVDAVLAERWIGADDG